MILLGFLRSATENGRGDRMVILRRRLIILLSGAGESELYHVAVAHVLARDESLDAGFDTALRKLRDLRDEGRRLADESGVQGEP